MGGRHPNLFPAPSHRLGDRTDTYCPPHAKQVPLPGLGGTP